MIEMIMGEWQVGFNNRRHMDGETNANNKSLVERIDVKDDDDVDQGEHEVGQEEEAEL